ncbi:unnamed protein product [Victoria cruziana]
MSEHKSPHIGYPDSVRFLSSSIKIPVPSLPVYRHIDHFPFSFPKTLKALIPGRCLPFIVNRGLFCASSLGVSRPEKPIGNTPEREVSGPVVRASRHTKEDEERVLISEVLVRNKDGEELENKELEAVATAALKVCRPNSALTVKEVREDVIRVIDSGLFASCMPVAVDTRDGIQLIFQVDPNQEFQGLICEGANVLPAKFLEDAFRYGYGKIVNVRHLDEVINSIRGWYMERGLFGTVSDVEMLSGGILRLKVLEAEVNNIMIRFLDRRTLQQGKRDVETVLTMGIMEDVSIIPQPAGVFELISYTLESSFAYSHRNLFGRNQKLNISLERGQIDSIFRINYTDPWIEGDDKRTSRSIMIQNSRTPGILIHGNQSDHGGITIGRVTSGIEFSRPFRPKWSGTAGLIFQHAGARDDHGEPIFKDTYGSPLTFSGNMYDDTLIAKFETVYTGSSDHGSSMFVFTMEQGLPVLSEWLSFNRVNARARTGVAVGPARIILSLIGGTVVGNFSPHEAFAIGGTNSVRGYEEGAVGSGRSYVVGSGEVSFPMFGPVEGAIFTDYGSDLGSGSAVPGDPAGARGKPGSGYGYGAGIRVESPLGPLRLEYAFNDRFAARFHFAVGYRN